MKRNGVKYATAVGFTLKNGKGQSHLKHSQSLVSRWAFLSNADRFGSIEAPHRRHEKFLDLLPKSSFPAVALGGDTVIPQHNTVHSISLSLSLLPSLSLASFSLPSSLGDG